MQKRSKNPNDPATVANMNSLFEAAKGI